jgi:hypothetical protein
LVKNGNITPDTIIENEAGKQTKAENITGLFPQPVPPAATSCPHCGEPMTAGEKFCGSCGKSVLVPTQPCPHCGATVAVGEKVCYHCGNFLVLTQLCPHCGATVAVGENVCYYCGKSPSQVEFYGTSVPYNDDGGFLDIGFTRFITPLWISVIWIICIVLNVISFLICPVLISIKAAEVYPGTGGFAFLLGIPVSIILHLFLLLYIRIVLELIIVQFKIEKNTRAMLSKQQ